MRYGEDVGLRRLKSEISNFKSICESISRQIRGWTNSLQNSDIEGQRHLNDRSRAQYESLKRKDSFDAGRRQWRADFEAKLKSDAVARCERIDPDDPRRPDAAGDT